MKKNRGRPAGSRAQPIALDMPTCQIAEFFGVTTKAVADWVKAGCPKIQLGVLNLKAVYDWRQANIEVSDTATPKLVELKAEEIGERIRKLRIANKEAEGKLVPLEDIYPEWQAVIAEFRQAALGLPIRLPPLLEGKDIRAMRDEIKRAVYAMLENLSREGKHRPARRRRKA